MHKNLLARSPASIVRSSFLAALTVVHAFAAPSGGVITSGSGSITQAGETTTITQNSSRLSLNWTSFNVASAETVHFAQPNTSAIAVNRIADVNGSTILGKLQANGQVFLINPHGLIFGAGSQVNVGGLVASTLDITDSDLAAGTRSFAGIGRGSVSNAGTITAAPGGYIALLGNSVSNTGTLNAPGGSVALGAGNRVTLDFAGDKLLSLAVAENTVAALAANGGLIHANGGAVYLTAGARDSLVASVVNNTGVIEARTVDTSKGTIILLGGMAAGTTTVAGTLDASAPNGGDGGFIETSAAQITIADSAQVTTTAPTGQTGTWLVDPTDFTITSGSGASTTSGIGAVTLSNNLSSTNVTLTTAATANGSDLGDIFVNASVAWATNTLTLSAHNNIYINADLTATGTASLALLYGQGAVASGNTADYTIAVGKSITLPAGDRFYTQLGSNGLLKTYTVITALGVQNSTSTTDLQGMSGNLSKNYALGANLDVSATSTWNSAAGFAPVGNATTKFTGSFAGLGHTLTGLTINRPTTDNVGLFGYTNGATIRDVGLVGGSVTGRDSSGSLVGRTGTGTTISNAYNAGSVTGRINMGGLVGRTGTGTTISNVYNTGAVTSSSNFVGGLVGYLDSTTLSNAYNTGAVTGGYGVGGLLGETAFSTISNVYSTGAVTGDYAVGGLVGLYNYSTTLSNAYSTGAVTGTEWVGGLVGYADGSAATTTISNAYSTGTITGDEDVGGLVGYAGEITLSNAYSTGAVSGREYVGGLVGSTSHTTLSNAYSTGAVTGSDKVGGLVGSTYYTTLSNAYSKGAVTGSTNVGGLLGINFGNSTISTVYWDTNTSGQSTSAAGTGNTTANMKLVSSYTGFDFSEPGVWNTPTSTVNNGYPTLQAFDFTEGGVWNRLTSTVNNGYPTLQVFGVINVPVALVVTRATTVTPIEEIATIYRSTEPQSFGQNESYGQWEQVETNSDEDEEDNFMDLRMKLIPLPIPATTITINTASL